MTSNSERAWDVPIVLKFLQNVIMSKVLGVGKGVARLSVCKETDTKAHEGYVNGKGRQRCKS